MLHSLQRLLLIVLCAALGTSAVRAQDRELEQAFPELSFTQPVDLQPPGDDSGRLFVVEQPGRIMVFEHAIPAASSAEVFLDIRDRVLDAGNEQGLLGLAFHPNFEENGYFFVDYTAGSGSGRTVLARYQVEPDDSSQVDKSSEEVILEVDQPFANHNAGQLVFGPDSLLYVTLGDGGSGGDPNENAQDRTTLLGSILRIDVDNPQGDRAYGIPDDNPFAGNTSGYREEIYAYGFRNPWRISFDAETGQLWAGDVGQSEYEEIDTVESGQNYGWDVMEGLHCYEPSSGCDQSGLTLPVHEYDHSQGQSITGGFVYRGERLPGLAGEYIYADYVSGRIWALDVEDGEVTNEELLDSDLRITSFGVDAENELYLLAAGGGIYRISPTNTAVTPPERPQTASRLAPNHPNPFRQATTLAYTLARPAQVELTVYDVLGRRVTTLVRAARSAGEHEARWTGTDDAGQPLAGGVYIGRLAVDGQFVGTRQMLLVR